MPPVLLDTHRLPEIGGQESPRGCHGAGVWEPLCDARWCIGLTLLVLNDLVLKKWALSWSSLGLVTGKLSDVAGLVVAPVSCAVLARLFTSQQRWVAVAFWCPVLVFVALKVSPTAAATWEALGSRVGVPQQVVADWTDLFTLPAALLARRILKKTKLWAPRAGSPLLAAVGALACLASTGAWEEGPPTPGIRNASEFAVTVGIQRYAVAIDCESAAAGLSAISESMLLAQELLTLQSGQADSLAFNPSPAVADDGGDVNVEQCGDSGASCLSVSTQQCGAAVVTAERFFSVLITWDLRNRAPALGEHKTEVAAGTVYLERFGDELRASPGAGMFVFPWK